MAGNLCREILLEVFFRSLLVLMYLTANTSGEIPKIYEPNVTKLVSNHYDSGWTEGPVFDKDGNFYMVTPTPEGAPGGGIFKVDLIKKKVAVLVEPKIETYHSMPNGANSDQDGNLWITDLRLGLLKVTPDGKVNQMMTQDSSGETIQGFNDVAFDYTGVMWITAPVGKIAPNAYLDGTNVQVNGSIYSYLPVEKKLVKLDTGYHYSNGIVVQHSKDGKPKTLIVCEFLKRTLWAYDITGPGQIEVSSKRRWGKLPGPEWGGFDGIDFDKAGNLLVTNFGASSIEVFGPTGGDPIGRIKMPFANVTNLEFKPGTKQVYVTEADIPENGLWTFEWINEGMPKYRDLTTSVASTAMTSWINIFVWFTVAIILSFHENN